MTLALDLAARDIDVTIVEQRAADARGDAKCNSVAARTMEVFRRLGVAKAVRAVGLADDYPADVSFRTSISGSELLRIPLSWWARRGSNPGQ
jgi:2-polyprenyl-6-methoxyphenol hydroxylase-like FAD-dependent oxidoreductase